MGAGDLGGASAVSMDDRIRRSIDRVTLALYEENVELRAAIAEKEEFLQGCEVGNLGMQGEIERLNQRIDEMSSQYNVMAHTWDIVDNQLHALEAALTPLAFQCRNPDGSFNIDGIRDRVQKLLAQIDTNQYGLHQERELRRQRDDLNSRLSKLRNVISSTLYR